MSTKKTREPAAQQPVVRMFIADDIRAEIDGKVSLIGLYPDSVLLVQMPADVPDPTREEPIALRSFGFLFNIQGLGRPVEVSIHAEIGDTRQPFMRPQTFAPASPDQSFNLLGTVSPFLVSAFGTKHIVVSIGDLPEQRFTFEIRRAPVSLAPNRATKAPKPPGPRKRKTARA